MPRHLGPPLLAWLLLLPAAHARHPALPGDGVALRIRSAHTRLRMLQLPVIHARLANLGEGSVTMVHPRDGGHTGLRTPSLSWSVLPEASTREHAYRAPHKPRFHCGNIRPLSAEDLVSVGPGEETMLEGFLGFPRFPRPGRYRVVLFYHHHPETPLSWWRSMNPLASELWARLRATPGVRLRSNELVFEVVP